MNHHEWIESSVFEGFLIWIWASGSPVQTILKRWYNKISHWSLDQELVDLGPGVADQGMAIRAFKE